MSNEQGFAQAGNFSFWSCWHFFFLEHHLIRNRQIFDLSLKTIYFRYWKILSSVTRILQFQATFPKLKYFRCAHFGGHLTRLEGKPQVVAAAGKAWSCRRLVPDPCWNFALGDCRHCSQQHWKRETWQNMFADGCTSEDFDWRCSDCPWAPLFLLCQ